jgi:hypothetical protein
MFLTSLIQFHDVFHYVRLIKPLDAIRFYIRYLKLSFLNHSNSGYSFHPCYFRYHALPILQRIALRIKLQLSDWRIGIGLALLELDSPFQMVCNNLDHHFLKRYTVSPVDDTPWDIDWESYTYCQLLPRRNEHYSSSFQWVHSLSIPRQPASHLWHHWCLSASNSRRLLLRQLPVHLYFNMLRP